MTKNSELYASDDIFIKDEPIRKTIGDRLRRLSANFQRSIRRKSKENIIEYDDDLSQMNSCANYDSVTTGNFESANSAGTAVTATTTLTPFFRKHPLMCHKFENMVMFRPGNLYSISSPGNQDYQKIIHFYFFS